MNLDQIGRKGVAFFYSCLLPVWYRFQHLICVYILDITYRRSTKYIMFWWK